MLIERFPYSPRFCFIVVKIYLLLSFSMFAATALADAPRTIGTVESNDPRVDPAAKIEVIAEGMTWCEGPVWFKNRLLFSDIPRNTIFAWSPEEGVTPFMQPSGYTGVEFYGLEPGSNGLAIDPDGRLCMCEHGDRRVSRLTPGGGKRTIVDNFQGKRLNSPNDLVFADDGTMYFTDPPYGLPKRENDPRRELDFCGVYAFRDGKLTLLSDAIERPNGIGLSSDQTRLVVAQSNPSTPNWTVIDLDTGSAKQIAEASEAMKQYPGLPDGLCVSNDDLIYASGPGGIYVMDFQGNRLGRYITGRRTSNCTLSPDGGTLYVTADDVVCRIKVR